MNPRVTAREAQSQLNRLIAVFPRHGMSEEGISEYADTMAGFFAGEWHMRKVVDAAKSHFRYFPSLAELRDLTDEISAKRPHFSGCPNCLRSTPGMAYMDALWTPGNDGRGGKFEPLSQESLEALRPQIDAAIGHAKSQGRSYDGQLLIERTAPCAAVGYCTCPAGTELRARRIALQAEAEEKRHTRGGMRKASA